MINFNNLIETIKVLSPAALIVALIAGGVSLVNGWRDRLNRLEIKNKELEMANELKRFELSTAKEIKEMELNTNIQIKQQELENLKELKDIEYKNEISKSRLTDFLNTVDKLNIEFDHFYGVFVTRKKNYTDCEVIYFQMSHLQQRADVSNPHYQEIINVINNLGDELNKYLFHMINNYKGGNEFSELILDEQISSFVDNLSSNGKDFNLAVGNYISYLIE